MGISAVSSIAGVLNLLDLMPDDLTQSWCRNNRNKVDTIKVMHLNHPQTSPLHPLAHGKIIFHETGPWCQKDWGPLSYTQLEYSFQNAWQVSHPLVEIEFMLLLFKGFLMLLGQRRIPHMWSWPGYISTLLWYHDLLCCLCSRHSDCFLALFPPFLRALARWNRVPLPPCVLNSYSSLTSQFKSQESSRSFTEFPDLGQIFFL